MSRRSSRLRSTLTLASGSYDVEYEYEAPEPDVGLHGGYVPACITDADGEELDSEELAARERAATGEHYSADWIDDTLVELATDAALSDAYDEDRFRRTG